MDCLNSNTWLSTFPLRSHLKTNYIPSDAEVLLIKSWLVKPCETVQQIHAEMLRLKKRVRFLSRRHEELGHQLATFRSLLTLPRRLPDDILLEIFHHSLPNGQNTCLYKHSTLLVLTHVCSRWRQLAHSTPTLWWKLHIPLANIEKLPREGIWDHAAAEEFHRRRATVAIDWLDRSRSLTINVSLFGGQTLSPFFDLYNKSLLPSSPRWKSLFLQAPAAALQEIATISAKDLNTLESLFLHFESTPGVRRQPGVDSPWTKSELFMAPSLRKLSIRQDVVDPTAIHVNWSTLTHLEIGGAPDPRGRHSPFLSMPKASHILKLCLNLLYCSIDLGPSWFNQDSYVQTMHLPVLRRLSIGERVDIQPFVEKLSMPMLEELTFRSTTKSREHSNCLAILSKTGGTVRKLKIDCEFYSNRFFLESLQCCTYLLSLTVGQLGRDQKHYERDEEEQLDPHFKIDDPFLVRLAAVNSTDLLCPHLEEFICRLDSHFTLTGLIEFIRRKQTIGPSFGLAKLKNISIEHLPNACNTYEFNLPEISEVLRPYDSNLMFQIQSSRLEQVAVGYGNSALQYTDIWSD